MKLSQLAASLHKQLTYTKERGLCINTLVPGARLELTHQESKSCALPTRLSGSKWWALLDSNQGTQMRPDLQSGGFSQLTQRPI